MHGASDKSMIESLEEESERSAHYKGEGYELGVFNKLSLKCRGAENARMLAMAIATWELFRRRMRST